jgi:hypothetical protein
VASLTPLTVRTTATLANVARRDRRRRRRRRRRRTGTTSTTTNPGTVEENQQIASWQHLSRLKASAFFFEIFFVRC